MDRCVSWGGVDHIYIYIYIYIYMSEREAPLGSI